ncbi:hypothetical protein CYK37_15110 [Mesorhizobium loti]|nr:hypothetical protein [Mesorhizobium loti]PLP58244.1 hypothetical protein CYK37_15110 [Mesorhizobium loti]
MCQCPVGLVEKPGAERREVVDGTALWVKSKGNIKSEEYTDFYRGVSGLYAEPAAMIHLKAKG